MKVRTGFAALAALVTYGVCSQILSIGLAIALGFFFYLIHHIPAPGEEDAVGFIVTIAAWILAVWPAVAIFNRVNRSN